jgi:hypothetical protein
MRLNQEPQHLLRRAIATHIQETAEELLYWMEELDKLPAAADGLAVAAPILLAAQGKTAHWAAPYGVVRARRKFAR